MTAFDNRRPETAAWRSGATRALLAISLFALVSLIVYGSRGLATADSLAQQPRPPLPGSSAPVYGVNFITSAEAPADARQMGNGVSTGATWDRWPIYWFHVERSPGDYQWASQDAAVISDLAYGLRTNAILLGTPCFYNNSCSQAAGIEAPPAGEMALQAPQAATPAGLYAPVFVGNGPASDAPGAGRSINSDNPWARFVFSAVGRYKPGGVLAQVYGWPAGVGVTHWEMWNEPDLNIFWDSSLADYARLLKVGYLAAKHADANAQIIFGAVANFQKPNFYRDVLNIYAGDSLAPSQAFFHDILATHSYSHAEASWYHVARARSLMAARGLDKPIWLNETGVPAWNDYPGPVWDAKSWYRGTMEEGAAYVIQTTLYATYGGADAIFHFQLYDGCGNQPPGTDFPPHNGELCQDGSVCAGDAHGLFRNPSDAVCFRQHPNPETPRPTYQAYRALTTHFRDVEPLWWRHQVDGQEEWLAFYRPASKQRIVGLWALYGTDQVAEVPATGGSALLVAADGTSQTLYPVDGRYRIDLPAATNQNAPWDPGLYMIGGRPFLLIENDTLGPTATLVGPPFAERHISLSWSGDDGLGSGLASFDVLVAVDGGQPALWLAATTARQGVFLATPGHTYTFYVVGRDRAGNPGGGAVLTVPSLILPNRHYLPNLPR
jgi:hypothetical protein